MMAAEGGEIITYIYNGQHRDDIPRNVTHLIVHENISVIPANLFYNNPNLFEFYNHPNLVEVYCHAGVIKIESQAFYCCRSLRRVIIPGVIIVEKEAFYLCGKLEYVKCDKLERIGIHAFACCKPLTIINLPSVKVVERTFSNCFAMTEAMFGKELESIKGRAFFTCSSLESITVPLKKDLLTEDDTFMGCDNLKRVKLVEGGVLREFADALLCDYWRNDVIGVLDSINQILPNTDAGDFRNDGGKAIAIREWIESVLHKIIRYKAAHCELLNEATTSLQLFLPVDMVMDNVLPFLELPAHTFDGETPLESTDSDIGDEGDVQEDDNSDG